MKSIYYCISGPPEAGGQYVNVEHIEALRSLGLRAYLLYIPSGAEPQRFDVGVPTILYGSQMKIGEGDIVVVPESWPKILRAFSKMECRKIIHCQNPYYLFHSFDSVNAIDETGYTTMLSCSTFTTQSVRLFGYSHEIHTIRPRLAAEFFKGDSDKKLQIAYMPRKRENETIFLKGLFKSLYPEYRDIPWVPIKNMTRRECAEILRESDIFASFSFAEGSGLPPLEAMACGCIVAGFDGQGGKDYATPANGFWVEEGDYVGFAHQLANAIRASKSEGWRNDLKDACSLTTEGFSPARFKLAMATAWKSILGDRYDDFLLVAD